MTVLHQAELPRVARPVSPLAVSSRPLTAGHGRRTLPVYGVCVHTTGRGPAVLGRKKGRPPIQVALDVYHGGREGPHYVIGYDGTIHAVTPEDRVAWHAGWGRAGRRRWASWTAPAWWRTVWGRWRAATPADLLPPAARDPNQVYIGVELLGNETASGFTAAQYDALARLVVDVARRHTVTIPAAPSPRLLGHEDLEPIQRGAAYGGWDPGAHRTHPVFSWADLWTRMGAATSGGHPTAPPTTPPPAPAPTPPAPAPRPVPPAGRRFRQLAALLNRYRGDIPLSFLLGWVAVESDGRNDVVTAGKNERGFFQIMPSESARMGFDHARLTADPEYSVRSGVQLVRFYADFVRSRYPWFPPGTELFWRIVKLQHAMGVGAAAALLTSMRKRNLPMTWEAVKRYEVTEGPHVYPLLNPSDPRRRGRFGHNVDGVFERGRQIAASLTG